jgi:polyphosphate kinase 2 (PPK2 family)
MKDKHKKKQSDAKEKAAPSDAAKLGGDLPVPATADEEILRLGKDCDYERELRRLQVDLVKLQEWIRYESMQVVVLFEGRDAAGKGGAIKRITESLNPRVCRVVALGTPTEREKTQWYFQRYVAGGGRDGAV